MDASFECKQLPSISTELWSTIWGTGSTFFRPTFNDNKTYTSLIETAIICTATCHLTLQNLGSTEFENQNSTDSKSKLFVISKKLQICITPVGRARWVTAGKTCRRDLGEGRADGGQILRTNLHSMSWCLQNIFDETQSLVSQKLIVSILRV